MSKRDLKKYLTDLDNNQLEEQIIELYDKFPAVKTYYDFVFNPRENSLLKESKIKISNEYFPVQTTAKKKRPKLRRSVAQKYIKHFIVLGVDPFLIGDIMLNSFEQAVSFMIANGILDEFKTRLLNISTEAIRQNWYTKENFLAIIERFDY